MSLTLTSNAFSYNDSIPQQYTCDGKNISPPLEWQDVPPKTKSLVLIVDDPDAPSGDWVHWILYNIPAALTKLRENLTTLPTGAELGSNSWNHNEYSGPCPPNGTHRYFFKLYALNTLLSLPEKKDKASIEAAMQGHIIENSELIAIYTRGEN